MLGQSQARNLYRFFLFECRKGSLSRMLTDNITGSFYKAQGSYVRIALPVTNSEFSWILIPKLRATSPVLHRTPLPVYLWINQCICTSVCVSAGFVCKFVCWSFCVSRSIPEYLYICFCVWLSDCVWLWICLFRSLFLHLLVIINKCQHPAVKLRLFAINCFFFIF